MQKILIIIICIMLVSMFGCTNENNVYKNKKMDEDSKQIIILMKKFDYDNMGTILKEYKAKFEKDKGINVNIDIIDAATDDECQKKINAKLYIKNGPTLIFISDGESYKEYIDQGIALKIADKIKNYNKIYSGIRKEGYFVSIGMNYIPLVLNKKILDEMCIPKPGLDWSTKDYFDIKKRWLDYTPRYFTTQEFWELAGNKFYNLEILDESNKTVSLNNDKVKDFIKNSRNEIFSGKYMLNENYNYENYYNMFFNMNSDEYKENVDTIEKTSNQSLRKVYFRKNPLKTITLRDNIFLNELVILPNVIYNGSLSSWGFIVNKNGENIDIGLEFISGLLSDDVQLQIYNDKRFPYYPVNKKIEKEIETIEKENNINAKLTELMKYLLSQIEEGKYKSMNDGSKVFKEIESMWNKQIVKFIFSDELYTDEELSRELQKVENKYNLWLNE
ncbi:extracellular solute-binding protein [Abyssisolibacter fermentans]|uniref:extracellular solute-binding protein n=1 Tax=Abyssisolibacter fermentans TaxID=1766203 RepID=UPI0008321684|nr:extracellular solute-binding protein [Abyssisolibacter fermentans]